MCGEASKDSDHAQDETEEVVSDAPSITENKASCSKIENSIFSKDLLLDNTNYAMKDSFKPNTNLSSIHLLENERKKCPEGTQYYPTVETGRQKPSYGVARETEHSASQNKPLESTGAPLGGTSDSQTQERPLAPKPPHEQEIPLSGYEHVVLRHKVSKNITLDNIDESESSVSSPGEESPPSENIAFMITKTAVQVLSSGEVHDIVNKKGGDVQTVNIDSKKEKVLQQGMQENPENEEPVVCLDKNPVIIIFDEPMDIRSAYKRLSTIFEECDEELEKMMTEEKIEEEEEEEDDDEAGAPHAVVTQTDSHGRRATVSRSPKLEEQYELYSSPESATQIKVPEEQEVNRMDLRKSSHIYGPHPESKLDAPDAKKKFKFKFPKKQLAALTQAIRTGTKTGKKTLQVVVYEEEEEEDGTLKQHKETKRFEIASSLPADDLGKQVPETAAQTSRTDEIRKNTYRTLDSLEQTIKQLESTISEMSPKTTSQSEATTVPCFFPPKEPIVLEESNDAAESPSSIPSASRKVL